MLVVETVAAAAAEVAAVVVAAADDVVVPVPACVGASAWQHCKHTRCPDDVLVWG